MDNCFFFRSINGRSVRSIILFSNYFSDSHQSTVMNNHKDLEHLLSLYQNEPDEGKNKHKLYKRANAQLCVC